ncbi:uncharacterized protein VP01_2540g2 [Puccinia sorghi]|uniref:GAG-pre-integrase domain-containing protein n=1 Tax=Puccinia sorghi TaxID=27349 RepID=A0A0L6V5D6_9BASI|nr:uncharacterized protein VP01_2540g2 [Puccinia sorghi]
MAVTNPKRNTLKKSAGTYTHKSVLPFTRLHLSVLRSILALKLGILLHSLSNLFVRFRSKRSAYAHPRFWASNHSHYIGSPKSLPSLLFSKNVELAHLSNALSYSGLKTLDKLLFINLNSLQAMLVKLKAPLDIHRALGHPSLPYLKKVFPNLKIDNLECVDCDRAKMHQQPFKEGKAFANNNPDNVRTIFSPLTHSNPPKVYLNLMTLHSKTLEL